MSEINDMIGLDWIRVLIY